MELALFVVTSDILSLILTKLNSKIKRKPEVLRIVLREMKTLETWNPFEGSTRPLAKVRI